MGKFEGILICTDCDGTLTDSNIQVSEENARAIRYFQNEGGRFTLATGRFPEHAANFADKLTVNAPIIAMNGALIYDSTNNKALAKFPMEKKKTMEVLKYLNDNWKGIWEYWLNFFDHSGACYKPLEDKFEKGEFIMENENWQCDLPGCNRDVFEKINTEIPQQLAKVVMIMPEEMLRDVQKDLRKKFGRDFYFDSSWPNGLEMQSSKSSKGKAVDILKKHIGNIKTTICIGDYDNDISMIKSADIVYAVDNAIPQVKSVADRITVSNNDSAIAKVIEEIMHNL